MNDISINNILQQSGFSAQHKTNRYSHKAMATIYEIFICDEDASYAQQASWEAFQLLDNLEMDLSRFLENSDIARINNSAAHVPVRIGLDALNCLQECSRFYSETDGAFDITVGSLTECWLNKDKTLRRPSQKEVVSAKSLTGMDLLLIHDSDYTVELTDSPVRIDLGGYGKGYAVDRMAELLQEWDINSFLIHGGMSSVLARGELTGEKGWPVSISDPFHSHKMISKYILKNRAMSGSGLQKGSHIIDPRTAAPLRKKRAVWTFASDAAECDALSTAFMIMSLMEIEQYCGQHPDIYSVILNENDVNEKENNRMHCFGRYQ
ncbi:FAD:protein FMN transferase [candidate division KSB1 bacterium]|nr:FAD:protein FMN transferase [candidate division KSB1 bacterium]